MTFSCIRPVTRSFPASRDCLEDSNLPFACVLTPLAVDDDDEEQEPHALTGIAKCLNCGAPHPDASTHFLLGGRGIHSATPSLLLCYLCARTSSTMLSEQQQQNGKTNDKASSSSSSRQVGSATLFALPLRVAVTPKSSQTTTKTTTTPLYTIPALSCPPLWFIVLDGSCTQRSYWQTVSQVLLDTLQQVPPHVHLSLLIASQPDNENNNNENNNIAASVAIYQLTSAVPHVLHMSSNEESTREQDLLMAVLDSLVPSSTSHIQSAVRSLMDYIPNDSLGTTTALPVAWMTRVILAALETCAIPAGQRHAADSGSNTATTTPRPYAGGKITYFLARRPAGLSPTHKTNVGPIDLGGLGGRTLQTRFDDNDSSRKSLVEWTPTSLWHHYQPTESQVELAYADLGKQCAEAALGVDLLCLVDGGGNHDSISEGQQPIPDFGLALCQSLSDKSGAPGPVLFDTSSSSLERLKKEVLSRTPWQPGRVFGAELRVRLSPGFVVDHQSVEYENNNKIKNAPQLAPLYCEAGLVGPAAAVDDSTHLWRMGTCDPFTSLTIDLALAHRKVKDRFLVDGFGEVALKPVIQTCLAYTTIVRNDKGQYQTVRRMRIASQSVPLASRVEDLYDSLDPEALAVVLFHKLAIASFQEGLQVAPEIAKNWLQSLLVCAYRSAEEQDMVADEEEAQELGPDQRSISPNFVANERLLDREGELPAADVLLAQGHKKLAPIPLMVYLLLQCDPLGATSRASLDLRVAALWQMSSMLPTNLARAIAPRLQLWASGDQEEGPILDIIDLSGTAIQDAIMEISQTVTDNTPLLLFLDAPDQILVMDARHVNAQATTSSRRQKVVMGSALQRAVKEAAESYRTPPEICYALEPDKRNDEMLLRVLMEDTPAFTGEPNFAAWRETIAAAVNEELLDST